MKRIAFLIAFAFTAATAAAQTYYPMPSTVGTTWQYRGYFKLPSGGYIYGNTYHSILKDTILNGVTYHDIDGFAYREAYKKVYVICYDSIATPNWQPGNIPPQNSRCPAQLVGSIRNSTPPPLLQEVQTLDFNLNAGDTIHTGLYAGSVVRSVQLQLVNGVDRRRLEIDCRNSQRCWCEESWTEGVGVTNVFCGESGYYFQTFTPTDNLATPTTQLSISPNPARDHINFQLPRDISAVYTVDIYDILGMLRSQQAMSADNQTVSTAALPSGTYFCRVRYDGKTQGAARFVIVR